MCERSFELKGLWIRSGWSGLTILWSNLFGDGQVELQFSGLNNQKGILAKEKRRILLKEGNERL
jgi:hypothetical protein